MGQPVLPALPRGYFAIGAERISKALNLGNLMRSERKLAQAIESWRALESERMLTNSRRVGCRNPGAASSWPRRSSAEAAWWSSRIPAGSRTRP